MRGATKTGRAVARANIALAKYWGKSDAALNLPAVPSVSVTLDPLVTETAVTFDAALEADVFEIGGRPAAPQELSRTIAMLDRVREESGVHAFAKVSSENRFPTASGLASSASGFAALAGAASKAAGLDLSASALSALARRSSASAARSVFGGFVVLSAGEIGDDALAASPLFPETYWDVSVVVAVVSEARKDVASTGGMEHTRRTSPYYGPWVAISEGLARRVRDGIAARDLEAVGIAMEESTMAMHACAIASAPATLYWKPATLAALDAVRALRRRGVAAYATMDAGPHVKVLCATKDADAIASVLEGTEGVLRTIRCKPGPGLEVFG